MRRTLTRPLCVLLIAAVWIVVDSKAQADELAIVSMAGSGEIAFIDIDAAAVIGSVQLPDRASFPFGIAVTPDGGAVAVACSTGYVAFIESGGVTTKTLLSGPEQSGITEIPNEFWAATVTPDGMRALVTEVNEFGQLFQFDMGDKELVGTPCMVGDDAIAIAIVEDPNQPGTDVAYLLDVEASGVHVLHWTDCTHTFYPLGLGEIGGFDVVPGEPRAIVTDGDNEICLFDTANWTLIEPCKSIDPARSAGVGDIAVSPDGELAIVSNQTDQSVTFTAVSDSGLTIVDTVDVEGIPVGIAFTQDGQTAVVALWNTSQVAIIHVPTRTVTATISTGLGLLPFGVLVAEMADWWTADDDGDTFIGLVDCDDTNPNCNTDCTDGDSDNYCVTTDCNEGDANTYPEAPEINDGLDNQCPGDYGHGLIDEIGTTLFFNSPTGMVWTPQEHVVLYQVVRSELPDFSADCLTVTRDVPSWSDTETPVPSPRYYLVRALTPHPGSWGADSSGAERICICP